MWEKCTGAGVCRRANGGAARGFVGATARTAACYAVGGFIGLHPLVGCHLLGFDLDAALTLCHGVVLSVRRHGTQAH
jgi:hypothetical protein